MEVILANLFLTLLGVVLLLNILFLPANWIVVGLVGIWYWLHPSPSGMNGVFFAMLVGLAVAGEVAEYVTQAWGAKKYGSTNGGMWAGLLGAFVGALLGVPFFFGLGALFGALVGAWLGCYGLERLRGRNAVEAYHAAKGAMFGRFLGLVIKCAVGVCMLALVYSALERPDIPMHSPAVPELPSVAI